MTSSTDRLAEPSAEFLFQVAFEHAPIGMAIVGSDGRWVQVNRSLCDLFGYSEEDFVDLSFLDLTHPEDRELGSDVLREGRRDAARFDKRYIHAEGRVIHALLSTAAVRSETGELHFLISQVKDITAQKESEERLLRLTAELEQKVASLEGLAFAASHHFQDPLRWIRRTSLRLLGDGYDLQPAVASDLERLELEAQRMQNLTHALARLVRTETVDLTPREVVLREVVSKALRLPRARLSPEVVRLERADAVVFGDRGMLCQLIAELLRNASEAGGADESLSVTVSSAETEDSLQVVVEDNGPGLDEHLYDRAFQPFAHYGPRAQPGVGLAIARAIAKRHAGSIELAPGSSGGTRVLITLPHRKTSPLARVRVELKEHPTP